MSGTIKVVIDHRNGHWSISALTDLGYSDSAYHELTAVEVPAELYKEQEALWVAQARLYAKIKALNEATYETRERRWQEYLAKGGK